MKDEAKYTLRDQQMLLDLYNEHFHPPPIPPGHLHGGQELTPGELLKVWEQAMNRLELRPRQDPDLLLSGQNPWLGSESVMETDSETETETNSETESESETEMETSAAAM